MTTKKKQKHSVVVTVPRKRSTTAASQSKNPEALRAEIEIPLSSDTIRIRMYRVGFGDCFLVSIPDGDSAHKHILVDCGVHGKGNINTIDKVIDNIATVTGRKLSLVIATHSHQDHISGFDPVKFKGFEVAEVWLPWVEDPKNSIAIALRKKQTALAAKLYAHFVAEERHNPVKGTALKKRTKAVEALANVIGLSDEKAKLASNATALKLLNSGFGDSDRVRYLSAGETLKNPGGINGLKVKILGPPTDQKFLAKMDPPDGKGYLALDSMGELTTVDRLQPFASKWRVETTDPSLEHLRLGEDVEKELAKSLQDGSLDALAFALDQAKNNTSIVALMMFRGESLLFPGDAQYGNWLAWLQQEESAEILSQITFLKVAHHGSHNATPRGALEGMTGKFAAMVSTQSVPWDSIPRLPLMDALNKQARRGVMRSDTLAVKNAPSPLNGAKAPSPLPDGFQEGALWYDYLIKT